MIKKLNILDAAYNEISSLASECGIDFNKIYPAIGNRNITLKKGIETDSSYKGKVAAYVNFHHHDGYDYPSFTFRTFKHGEHTTHFNGAKWWGENKHRFLDGIQRPAITRQALPTPKIDDSAKKLAAFNTEFSKLPSVASDSDLGYLAKKGFKIADLPTNLTIKHGTDNHGHFIAVAIENHKFQTIAFQKIHDNAFYGKRNKTFLGKVSSGYTVLGTIESDRKVFYAEGLAEGLVAYLCGYTVIVCYSVDNLYKVYNLLKTDLDNLNCKQVVMADNDISSGGNTGVYYALLNKVDAVIAKLDGKKCDFNDVFLARGIDEAKRQLTCNTLEIRDGLDYLIDLLSVAYLQKIPQTLKRHGLKYINSIVRQADINHLVTTIADGISHRGKVFQDAVTSYLQKAFNARINRIKRENTITNWQGLDVIDAAGLTKIELAKKVANKMIAGFTPVDARHVGAGKTENMKLVSDLLSVTMQQVYASCRVSIIKNTCERLGFADYQAINPFKPTPRKLGVCSNSAPKFAIDFSNTCVFNDESRQDLEHILNGTVDNRQQVYDYRVEMFKNAKMLYLADADMNDFTIDWLKSIRKDVKIVVIIDSTKQGKNGKTINVLTSQHAVLENVIAALSRGENVWLCTDSIKNAVKCEFAIESFVKTGISANEILLITSENKGDTRQAAFLANPNEESKKYRIVIASPVISSGVSVTSGHFQSIYGSFYGVLSANEILQTIGRVRDVNNIYLSLQNRQGARVSKADLIDAEMFARMKYKSGNLSIELTEMDRLRYELRERKYNGLLTVKTDFLLLAEMKGYTIELDGRKSQTIKGLKQAFEQKKVSDILSARIIDKHEAAQISESNATTQAQSNSLARHETVLMTGKQPHEIDDVDVSTYLKGGIKQVFNRELIESTPLEKITESDLTNLATRNRVGTKLDKYTLLKGVIDAMSNCAVINEQVCREKLQVCARHYARLVNAGLGNLRNIGKYPVRKMNDLLNRAGYELVETKRKENGERTYTLVKNAVISAYVAKRAENSETA